ncbi:MAG TPA: pilus assembly PilX N-terminal domain-containing protein [Polyangia bacterium]|nr:pilus assembly PilX N-terminal domain-containing protein [Polyangia bacterium]
MTPHRRRDRGFSLVIVFMLMTVMVGVAATVILSTQQDLSVAGQDREALQAFYAAEYGVAQAKDFLAGALASDGINAARFVAGGGWTPILAQVTAAGAAPGCATGPLQPSARMAWRPLDGSVRWSFCIHNNSDDLAYLDPGGSVPAGCIGKSADACDERDPLHVITIEAWGASASAQAHVAVDVAGPALATAAWRQY